jgi:alpha-N-arabinofuranosidase
MKFAITLFVAMNAWLSTQTVAQAAETATLSVQMDQSGAPINHAMWGIFFEDINFGADGGLYAELVKNRSFEFPDALMGWKEVSQPGAKGTLSIATDAPFNTANPHYLRIGAQHQAAFGAANNGFRGIGVRAGEEYDFSTQARVKTGSPVLVIQLVDEGGKILAAEKIKTLTAEWAEKTTTLHPKETVRKARLNVLVENGGTVDLDMVSLFPRGTWKRRPSGLRADMVQWLADMKPGFMRFPGGCIVEGDTLTNRYQWKTTIGPIAERKLIINRWNKEFKHRPTPDYYQSFGLGFFEYFQLCEDIGAQPLPILNCGMACQFNSGELCPLDQIDPYIQDAIDLVEFANGPANSVWGAKRAAMGHSKPFALKMIGIGNEQWDQPYLDRYTRFHAALKAKHPEILLVSSAGPAPDDQHFKFAWPKLRALPADIVDEHCYARPDWFFNNTHRYDDYDRNGPKVFFGEYAAQSDKTVSVENRNNLECALSEAACMIGLERNGDVVRMASYAPLFAHNDGWQWRPDLIWVDNLQSYGTPNYYVQKLFANNAGDLLLPVKLDAPSGAKLFASATRDNATGETILKVVNGGELPTTVKLDFGGAKNIDPKLKVFTLTSGNLKDENSFSEPRKVAPNSSTLEINGPQFSHTFAANSLTVLRLGTSTR